jgi:hypothetical protein
VANLRQKELAKVVGRKATPRLENGIIEGAPVRQDR